MCSELQVIRQWFEFYFFFFKALAGCDVFEPVFVLGAAFFASFFFEDAAVVCFAVVLALVAAEAGLLVVVDDGFF